ncbi:MAG: RNA polymerase sigma factor [Deltaproteobacteria bacterium]
MTDDTSRDGESFDKVRTHLANGDEAGAREVFDRFAKQLIAHARQRMSPRVQQKVDPEDIVQSAFKSFFRRQEDGQFTFENWESLWGLLLQITLRKCHRWAERFSAQRRNLGAETPLSAGDRSDRFDQPSGHEPGPSEVAILNETIDALKAELDPIEWDILTLRLDEHSVPEISRIVSRSERTVARALQRIRRLLGEQPGH